MAAVEVRVVSAERPTAGCDACFRFQEAGGREGKELRGFSVHSAAVKPAHVGFQSNSGRGLLHGLSSGFPSGNW